MPSLSIVVSDVDEVRTYTVSNTETGQTVYTHKSITFDDEGEKALMLRMVATICKGRLQDATDDVRFCTMGGSPVELLSQSDHYDFPHLF
jgi:hypothetical protein